jgi:serine/threonine-protein kinase
MGLVIDGKYRLIGLRGEGAMGSVWHAEHMQLGYAVAIKFLHKAIANLRDSRGRFEREAKIAARLGEASSHVARVLDHGVLDNGMPYVVMELLDGEGLDAVAKREGRLALAEVSRIVTQLARALEVAHAHRVVHRDLKLANIFLCREDDDDPTVKLLDFGVAKATLENVSFSTTTAGALIGTPSYMAPEQIAMGTDVDARTDLWALGVVTYRLTTGQMPFGKGTLAELALRIVTVDPAPPTSLVPELPPALDAWMARALAKKQDDRFQSARAMATSLAEVARDGTARENSMRVEVVATKREGSGPAAAAPPAFHATLLSKQAPTLMSNGDALAAPTIVDPPRVERSRAPLIAIIAAGLISGCFVTLWLSRSHVHADVVTPPKSSIALSSTAPSPTASMVASASTAAVAPLESVALPATSASTARPASTHAHAHARAPHSANVAASAPATASSDDWNSRNQM